MDIAEHCDSFKAPSASQTGTCQTPSGNSVDIVRTIGRLPINPTAKLVAITMRTTRVVDTKQLAAMLGLSMRVVQRSKNEYSDASDNSDTYVANPTNPATPTSLSPEPRAHAPAQMEYPTGIVSYEVASKPREGEIPGLNGSTHRYVDMLAGWLAGDLRPKEPDVAYDILAGNVEHYGADQVKAGMLELQAAIGAGQRPRDPGKAFSGFVKNAKPPRANETPKQSKIDDRIARARALMSPEGRAAAEANDRRLAS